MADFFVIMITLKTKPMLTIYNNCSDDNPTNKLPKLGGLRPPQTPPSGVLIMEQQGGLRLPCKCQTFTLYINFF